MSILKCPITFSGLAKVAIFTTNVDAENQTLINHKCVCGALNRHFCQTRVMGCLNFVGLAQPLMLKALKSILQYQHTILQLNQLV